MWHTVTYNNGDMCLYLDGEQVGKGAVPPGLVELNWDLDGRPNEQLHGKR